MIGSAYSEVSEILVSQGNEKLVEIVEAVKDKDVLLLDAAYALDESVIAAALQLGANPNARSNSIGGQGAETPLHRAVRGHGSGSFEAVVKLLVEAGADTLARNAAKDTALHTAMFENEERAIVLVRLGLDPLQLDDARQPLFIKAVLLNMLALAELLLERGVPVDIRDDRGQTALLVATREGRIAAAKFLLEHGADPNAADNKQFTPKRVALESDDHQLAMLFSPPSTTGVQDEKPKKPQSGCAIGSAVLLVVLVLIPMFAFLHS